MKYIIAFFFSVILFIPQSVQAAFPDVASDYEHYQAIEYLKNHGVVVGFSDGSFRPEQPTTRAEFTSMAVKSIIGVNPLPKIHNNCFKDIQDQWFAGPACFAKKNDFVRGYDDNTFRGNEIINTEQAIAIVTRMADFFIYSVINERPYPDIPADSIYAPYARAAKEKGIMPESREYFEGARSVNRGLMAEILYRVMILEKTGHRSFLDYISS